MDKYRYGMNGQEKDNEVFKGAMAAEYWEYDSRIGRRWEQDPITYEDQSPYVTFNNNPLVYSDPTGLVGEDEIKKVWNNKTGQYDEVSRTDKFGKGTDLTHYEGGEKDGQHVVTSERGTWTYGEHNGNKYGDLNSHRQWQAYSGYHSNETKFDRMFRLMGNAHLEEMRDFGGGGYNMFGGYGRLAGTAQKLATGVENTMARAGSLAIEEGGAFSQSEINAAKFMSEQGKNVFLRTPKGTRAGGGTSDLLVDGIRYDVYTPKTSSAKAIISAMAKKNSQTHGIVLDLSQTSVKASELGNALKRVQGAGATNIKDIVIMGGK